MVAFCQANAFLARCVLIVVAVVLGLYGAITWKEHSAGIGALAWAGILAYTFFEQLLAELMRELSPQRAPPDSSGPMFQFSNLTDDFWMLLPLTSSDEKLQTSIFVSFTVAFLSNVLNIAFLTLTLISLPHFDITMPNCLGRHVVAWIEVPLVYMYLVAWWWPFMLLLHNQRRLRDPRSDAHSLEWGTVVRLTAQWFNWLGKISSLNLLRYLHPTDLFIRIHGAPVTQIVRTVLQMIVCSVLGFMAVRIKIANVSFLVDKHVFQFTIVEWFKLVGFVNNILGIFNLKDMRIGAMIQAHQIDIKEWLTKLADHLAHRENDTPVGAFVRMVALQPLHVNMLLMELRSQAPRDDQGNSADRAKACRNIANPALPPPLYGLAAEVFKAHQKILQREHSSTSLGVSFVPSTSAPVNFAPEAF